MPPVPLAGVLVTIAYISPLPSSPKPCTVSPLGRFAVGELRQQELLDLAGLQVGVKQPAVDARIAAG